MTFNVNSHLLAVILLSQGLTLTVGTAVQVPPTINQLDGETRRVDGNDSNSPLQLTYLGAVDGRSYYVEPSLTMSWTEAKAYCNASNMELASVETKAQHDLLIQTLEPYGDHVAYWTSLRLAEVTPDMLSWDGTNQRPDRSFLIRFNFYVVQPEFCAAYYHRNANLFIPSMDVYLCSHKLLVLCHSEQAII